MLEDGYVLGRRLLREAIEDLRSRDRFFRWKAAVVATWLLLSFAAVGIVGSGGAASPATNRLSAYVVLKETTMGWALFLENRSKRTWDEVEIRLDGFAHRPGEVPAGQQLVLSPAQFLGPGGSLTAEHDPRLVEILSTKGSVTIELASH